MKSVDLNIPHSAEEREEQRQQRFVVDARILAELEKIREQLETILERLG